MLKNIKFSDRLSNELNHKGLANWQKIAEVNLGVRDK